MEKLWGDKRYYSLNYFLRSKFGCKVFKISLDAGFSCPNRDGTISLGGCIFCSERGSGDFAGKRSVSLTKQFSDIKAVMNKKWKCGKFIAYFQAYTNTYGPIEELRRKYYEALNQEGVVGIAIATRPDCLSEDVINLLEEINKSTYLWIELGLQTINEDTALLINRGYTMDVYNLAVKKLRDRNITVVVHTIFGLPSENREDMLNTIKFISNSDIQGVKFHLLHLIKDTPLVNLYDKWKFDFLSMEEYVETITKAISILSPHIVVHRLTGDAPRDMLIGPKWSLKKWEVLNAIDKKMEIEDIYQGKYFDAMIKTN